MKNAMNNQEYAMTAIYSLVYKAGSTIYPNAVEFVPVGHSHGRDCYVGISCWANNPELVYFASSERSCYALCERDYLTFSGELFDIIGEYVCCENFNDEPYVPVGYAVRLTDAHKALMNIIRRYGK